MNYGIVDIGSNTIRCNVYHINDQFHKLFSKKHTAGLASYVENKELTPKGVKKLMSILESIILMTDQVDLTKLYVFATASLRKVNNSEEIIKAVKKRFNIDIDLLPVEKEASLGFLGISPLINSYDGITCDIGGGSSEVVIFEDLKEKEIFTLDEGSLSMYKQFVEKVVPTKKETAKMKSYLKKKIKTNKKAPKYKQLVGIGGTMRAARNVINEIYNVPVNTPFKVDTAKELLNRFSAQERDVVQMVLKVSPARIHTFAPGLTILLEISKYFSVKEVLVVDNGLREGYLLHKLEENHE